MPSSRRPLSSLSLYRCHRIWRRSQFSLCPLQFVGAHPFLSSVWAKFENDFVAWLSLFAFWRLMLVVVPCCLIAAWCWNVPCAATSTGNSHDSGSTIISIVVAPSQHLCGESIRVGSFIPETLCTRRLPAWSRCYYTFGYCWRRVLLGPFRAQELADSHMVRYWEKFVVTRGRCRIPPAKSGQTTQSFLHLHIGSYL